MNNDTSDPKNSALKGDYGKIALLHFKCNNFAESIEFYHKEIQSCENNIMSNSGNLNNNNKNNSNYLQQILVDK